ncbi:MAG: inorganic phosphate transporter [Bacteroidales bacterium]
MEHIYLIIVIFLGLLAISDLIVGVSNDAVNFLNSAIGSKIAPFRTIMLVAAMGVLIGATFSSGMMEVARSGIFNPEMLSFKEVMVIFMAVMITDVALLNIFNSFGLPTSTTVSLVFELLGGSVAVAVYKLIGTENGLSQIGEYINTANALGITSGILISVAVAFTVGCIVQYISRILFTFNYGNTYRYFGGIFAGISVTTVFYFLVMKGAKGSSFMTNEMISFINEHTTTILLASFLIFTVIFQAAILFFKANVFKFIILAGTFSLAFAFAGNDLVNFIGVPLAGLESYRDFVANGAGDSAASMLMSSLTDPVKTPTYLLLIAGCIMILTLYFSKKAKKVIQTSIQLSSQSQEKENFQSTPLSRAVVRVVIKASDSIDRYIPESVNRWIAGRFIKPKLEPGAEVLPFDHIRASVNLVVSAILIASATSLKLPLSTTYVTFMVAMGTSLIDGAWGRDTAVYRVSGVITIIGGWFFTGFSAFTAAFLLGILIMWGNFYIVFLLAAFVIYLIVKSNFFPKKDEDENGTLTSDLLFDISSKTEAFNACYTRIQDATGRVMVLFNHSMQHIIGYNLKGLKEVRKDTDDFNQYTKNIKRNIPEIMNSLSEESVEAGHYYVQILDQMREIAHSLTFIAQPSYEHMNNNHTPFHEEQTVALRLMQNKFNNYFIIINKYLSDKNYEDLNLVFNERDEILELIVEMQKEHLRYLREYHVSTKSSVLYLAILNQSKNLAIHMASLMKALRAFYYYKRNI